MTATHADRNKSTFDPFMKIKKGQAFECDRLKRPNRIHGFDADIVELMFALEQKIVPILGRSIRIHLNRNPSNKPELGLITITGAQGKVLNLNLTSEESTQIFRLFPFQNYTKLEAFLCKESRRIYIYDVLVRDGKILDPDILARETYLPITNKNARISCLRSYRSLASIYTDSESLYQNDNWKGFLIRSGSNNLEGLYMSVSV